MKQIQKYSILSTDTWTGRVDDKQDRDAFRWHQCVRLIDLNTAQKTDIAKNGTSFCFLGFFCDKGVEQNKGRVGTALGPFSIRRAMADLPNIFAKQGAIYDAGNIHCLDGNLASAQENLAAAVQRILALGLFPVVLGGGHEIAYGNYTGIRRYGEAHNRYARTGIINFDAHFDMRPYDQGPSSGTMFRQIADDNRRLGTPFAYFVLGIQKTSNTLRLFKAADDLGVEYVLARDIKVLHLDAITRKLDAFINRLDAVYLTICSDGFSSAFAPGVSSPQPFGMNPEIVLQLIKHIVRAGKTVSVDIAEVSPRFDDDNQTAKLASVVIYTIINTMLYPEDS